MCRLVIQEVLCLINSCLAMPDVTSPKFAVDGLRVCDACLGIGLRHDRREAVAQRKEQFVERGSVAHSHVVNLVAGLWAGGCGGQQVGLHSVGHVREVAAGFTIAVDVDGLALEQCGRPFGDDGGIGAVGVLAGAKHIEVAQANGVKTVAAGKHVGIQLVHVFGHGVGAQGFADVFFHLGQGWVVAIGAAAGGVGKALHFGVACGHQHVQKAGDVGGIGGDGVGQAAGHAAQGGLVQDVVHGGHRDGGVAPTGDHGWAPAHGFLAVFQLADVAFNEVEVGPLGGGDEALHFVQIALVPSGKVVQPHHALVEREQSFEQVAANEARHPGYEPGFWGLAQLGLYLFVAGHVYSLGV